MNRASSTAGDEASGPPRAPIRTLQIVEIVGRSAEGLTLAQISRRLEIPKTTSLSLLRALVESDYLSLVKNKYTLGMACYRMTYAVNRTSLIELLRPIMRRLSDRIRETATLSAFSVDRRELEYIEVFEPDRSVRYAVKPGDRRPLYAVSSGLILLASLSAPLLNEYVRQERFRRFTDQTIGDATALHKRLEAVKAERIAITHCEYSYDASGFAVPVYGVDEKVVAALAVGAPTERGRANQAAYVRSLLSASAEASVALGIGRGFAQVAPE